MRKPDHYITAMCSHRFVMFVSCRCGKTWTGEPEGIQRMYEEHIRTAREVES